MGECRTRASVSATREALYAASGDAVSCSLDAEAAILDLGSGVYYTVNEVGAYLWRQLDRPRRPSELRRSVRARYRVGDARCRRDVAAFLEALVRAGLIHVAEPAP